MIATAIGFLRNRLNRTFPRDAAGSAEDLFVYPVAGKDDALSFPANAVSILLVRLEEDAVLRDADRFTLVGTDGSRRRVEPDIRLNLYVLFVARFPEDYGLSLQHLSRVVRYFQNHRIFTQQDAPELGPRIPQLIMELITPGLSEQNELWGMLRVSYQPSALYRLKMLVFQDEEGAALAPTTELIQHVVQLNNR